MSADAVINLKVKFMKDFEKVRQSLYNGSRPNITTLKYLSFVINDSNYFDNKTYEYFITL